MYKKKLTAVDLDTITASAYGQARERCPEKFIEWCLDQLIGIFSASTAMWSVAVPLDTSDLRNSPPAKSSSPSPVSDATVEHPRSRTYRPLNRENFRIETCGIRCAVDQNELHHSDIQNKSQNQLDGFYGDYQKVEHLHPLLPLIITHPSKGYSFDTRSDAALNSTILDLNFVQHSHRYDIPKSLAIAFPVPRTRNQDMLMLWRRNLDVSFTSDEIHHLEKISIHLSQALQHSRTFAVSSRVLEFWDRHNAVMTLNENGFLVDIDKRFQRVIDRNWPNSSISNLPAELVTLLKSDSNQNFRKGDILFNRYFIDAHRIVVATELGELAALTQRELEISVLFASGEDNKTIADSINRSSSTVRNHLRNIYHKLGINSRSELVDRLQRLTSMPQ